MDGWQVMIFRCRQEKEIFKAIETVLWVKITNFEPPIENLRLFKVFKLLKIMIFIPIMVSHLKMISASCYNWRKQEESSPECEVADLWGGYDYCCCSWASNNKVQSYFIGFTQYFIGIRTIHIYIIVVKVHLLGLKMMRPKTISNPKASHVFCCAFYKNFSILVIFKCFFENLVLRGKGARRKSFVSSF